MKTIPRILKDNICTMFNLLNVLIAIALAAAGAWKNMVFILAVAINAVVGIVQEIKAKRRIEKLSVAAFSDYEVVRGGEKLTVKAEEIGAGDEFELSAGAFVPTDCIIKSGTAEINEAVLTGESEPVMKNTGEKLFGGSAVISGRCRAEAACTGAESFTSKMVDEVKRTVQSRSELLQSMKKVTKFTGMFIIPLGILMFAQSMILRKTPFDEAVVASSAGLLGMLPKGLVLLISIGFAAGVIKLSKRSVLVREMHSLENLAHCDVLCFDKTGTLTEGELEVEEVHSYIDDAELEKLMAAYLEYTDDNNSTYIALKKHFGGKKGYRAVASVPFSSERKYSSVTLDNGKMFVIGAPERLCKSVPAELAGKCAEGKRVVIAGICGGEIEPEKITVAAAIVISDKVRESAAETIEYFYSQGVDVKVISGDNPAAAAKIAETAGIKNAGRFIDMSKIRDGEIEAAAEKYTVFGRVSPNRKKELVAALQKDGHKVAMLGDGVNDLLAMRRADASVAMGNGNDSAKQAAQIVLVNSDFSALRDVISEGRRVINNITKSAGVFFIKTIYSVLLCVMCLILNKDFPFIPIQITLIDAVIEGYPAFFMSFEKNDKKCEGSFLNNAFSAAFPNAAAIFLCCLILWSAESFGASEAQCGLLMYLSVGFISLGGVFKASMPLNRLRGFLSVTAAVGFVAAIVLFSGILQIPHMTVGTAVLLPVMLAVGFAAERGVASWKLLKS